MTNRLDFVKKLFLGFFLIIAVLILSVGMYFYKYTTNVIITNEQNNSRQVVQKISDQIDTLYRKLDNCAAGYTQNRHVVDIMVDLNSRKSDDQENLAYYEKKLWDNIPILFFNIPESSKIIIFNIEQNFCFMYGETNNSYITDFNNEKMLTWYNNLLGKNTVFKPVPPHFDSWSSLPQPVISIYRKLYNSFYDNFGILEIQIPYKFFADICRIEFNPGCNVLVFDEKGSMVYPFNQDLALKHNPADIYKSIKASKNGTGEVNSERNTVLFTSFQSDYTRWTTAIVNDKNSILQKATFYRNIIVLSGILILLIVLTAYFILVRILTRPLRQLVTTVKEVDLDNLTLEIPHSSYNEFKMLNNSFNTMFSNLKDSINKLYEAKIRESNAHFLALQAQMKPHFLFNTISVIAASCQRFGNTETQKMCNKLSGMLRYITSSQNTLVTVNEEILHTIDYLELMKKHYEDYRDPSKEHLKYEIIITENMKTIMIPKLTIQPLVENCIIHGFDNTTPPWNIAISGHAIDSDRWEIKIRDNGEGFDMEVLQKIKQQLEVYSDNLEEGNFDENLNIGGMGILNTYARLAIHFKENTVFEIENLPGNGSVITIGGTINHKVDSL